MSIFTKRIVLAILMLSGTTLYSFGQDTPSWQLLEDNETISVYYSPLTCGDEIMLGEEVTSSLALKVVRKDPQIMMATVIVDVTDGTTTRQGHYAMTFDTGDESVYDCVRLPHMVPTGPLPFSNGSTISLVDLFTENQ